LALFPFAIFVAGVGAFTARELAIENPAQAITDRLAGTLPPEAASLIRDELQRVIDRQDTGLISFGVLAAVFFATGGTNALIKAMNRAFEVEETRPLWRRYLVAIGMTLLGGGSLIGAFILFVSGSIIVGDVARQLGLEGTFWRLLPILRWPIVIGLLFAAVVVLYRVGPNLRLPLRWIMPGAALFVLAWLAATWAFGWYVAGFASYGSTYGALAGVAILLVWFYLTSFILLIGVEINDVIAELHEPNDLQDRREVGEDSGDGD
jgi:membrane protein